MHTNNDPEDAPFLKLTKDLKKGVERLTPAGARFVVDAYYQWQENRIRADGQIRSMAGKEPHEVLDWLSANSELMEGQIKAALNAYAKNHHMGRWAMAIHGLGPVTTAGLLAYLQIEHWKCAQASRSHDPCKAEAPCSAACHLVICHTVGHFWRFAGLDPSSKWNKGEKRPWNATLKVICWKIGQSFVKVSGNPDAFYGRIYREQKAKLVAANDDGAYAQTAIERKETVGKATDAWAWYAGCYPAGTMAQWLALADLKARAELLKKFRMQPGGGEHMLPPAHIQARAERYAVKLFLSHYHAEMYRHHFGKEPPLPYPIAHLGHAHQIPTPAAA